MQFKPDFSLSIQGDIHFQSEQRRASREGRGSHWRQSTRGDVMLERKYFYHTFYQLHMNSIALHGEISLLAIGGHHHIDTGLVNALETLSPTRLIK